MNTNEKLAVVKELRDARAGIERLKETCCKTCTTGLAIQKCEVKGQAALEQISSEGKK